MVMGDNTCDSSDSRTWGSVSKDNVTGKAFFVYWPLTSRFGWGND
jgi:signal peptidase I